MLRAWQVFSKQEGQRINVEYKYVTENIPTLTYFLSEIQSCSSPCVNLVKSPDLGLFQIQMLWLEKEKEKPLFYLENAVLSLSWVMSSLEPSKLLSLLKILTKDTQDFPHCIGQCGNPLGRWLLFMVPGCGSPWIPIL